MLLLAGETAGVLVEVSTSMGAGGAHPKVNVKASAAVSEDTNRKSNFTGQFLQGLHLLKQGTHQSIYLILNAIANPPPFRGILLQSLVVIRPIAPQDSDNPCR